ncbi:MAG: hypothetical protein KJP12_06990 [Acidimicrobiia bacterium]|nr:hypothetical protein [Acidimicrobiia bacterium]NNK92071.1 hypothetical protein [Acidimicrobiia bacterium]
MTDVVVRLVLAAVLAGAVVGVARALASRRPSQRRITLTGVTDSVVLFTSTDCTNCAAAREAFKIAGIPIREVTWELEGSVLEAAGVTEVPTTVVIGPDGETIDQMSGVPSPRRARRMGAMLGHGPGAGYRTSP